MTTRKPLPRQIFVLTPDEKKAVCCVIGAFLLGIVTMHYRAKHPRSVPPDKQTEHVGTKGKKSRQPFVTSPRPQAVSEQGDE